MGVVKRPHVIVVMVGDTVPGESGLVGPKCISKKGVILRVLIQEPSAKLQSPVSIPLLQPLYVL
jgi:hypothetical protein